MDRYRKKPIVVEAMQYDGSEDSRNRIVEWAGTLYCKNYLSRGVGFDIDTLEGVMTVSPGDWVIRGVAGEFYPCNPDIFEATYEAADTPVPETLAEFEAWCRGEGRGDGRHANALDAIERFRQYREAQDNPGK